VALAQAADEPLSALDILPNKTYEAELADWAQRREERRALCAQELQERRVRLELEMKERETILVNRAWRERLLMGMAFICFIFAVALLLIDVSTHRGTVLYASGATVAGSLLGMLRMVLHRAG